ncbi:MAG: hypothetical protein RR053_03985 [Evtepia sp.]
MQIRTEYIAATCIQTKIDMIADYGDRVYRYSVDADWEKEGELSLVLTEPSLLKGVTARVAAGESQLMFDGIQLETGSIAADGLSPLDSFPVCLRYIREGYIETCNKESLGARETLRIFCKDPQKAVGEGREGILWFDAETHALLRGEILNHGDTVIQCEFLDFTIEK